MYHLFLLFLVTVMSLFFELVRVSFLPPDFTAGLNSAVGEAGGTLTVLIRVYELETPEIFESSPSDPNTHPKLSSTLNQCFSNLNFHKLEPLGDLVKMKILIQQVWVALPSVAQLLFQPPSK